MADGSLTSNFKAVLGRACNINPHKVVTYPNLRGCGGLRLLVTVLSVGTYWLKDIKPNPRFPHPDVSQLVLTDMQKLKLEGEFKGADVIKHSDRTSLYAYAHVMCAHSCGGTSMQATLMPR